MTILPENMNTYRVQPVMLNEKSADEIILALHEKIQAEEKLEREELVKLLLTPLMSGEMDQYKRIENSFLLLEQCENVFEEKYEKEQFQAVLYTFASKFLEQADMERLKEVIGMTYLGELLMQDGVEKGMERGVKQSVHKLFKWGMPPEKVAEALEIGMDLVRETEAETIA